MGNIWITLLAIGILHVSSTNGQFRFKSCTNASYLTAFPGNCFKFLACASTGYVAMNCPSNLVFNEPMQYCDYRSNVPRCRDAPLPGDCSPNPCVRGTCEVITASPGYECRCDPGFTGFDCSSDIDECANAICVRGTCENSIGNFTCDCGNSGYTGRYCHIAPRTPCIGGQACQEGTCQSGPNTNVCICNTGYTGRLCDTPLPLDDLCVNSPCLNGGRCTSINSNSDFTCNCTDTEYTGRLCGDVPVENECQDNPCGPGVCVSDPAGGLTCNCTGTGFEGLLCDFPVNDCLVDGENRCRNGGTCVELEQEFVCMCAPGFTGGGCETLVNPTGCPPHPCPVDVPFFNYPDWNDVTCSGYYNCMNGTLQLSTCPPGQKFDTITMTCIDETDTLAVFCNEFRL